MALALGAQDPVGEQTSKQTDKAASYTEIHAVMRVAGGEEEVKREDGLESLRDENIADTMGDADTTVLGGILVREVELGKGGSGILLEKCQDQ